MSNEELRYDVEEELFWEPRVDNEAIAVSTDDGDVALRGTVGSFREKREAANAAKRVYGVAKVDNELSVRLLDGDRRDDADVRGAVLQALMLDAAVPSSIDASVKDGMVTLTGMAPFNYQRVEAEFVAGNVPGVISVDDQVELTIEEPTPADVRHSIAKAFKRDASLDAEALSIDTLDGTVTLSGHVDSWVEHDAAVNAAWAAPSSSAARTFPGGAGGPTSASARGAPSARTTAPTATRGRPSRTTTRVRAPTGGARTGWAGSATTASCCAWRSRSGTGTTPSSRSGCSGSPGTRATTARTPRSTGGTSTRRRRTRGCAGATSIRRRRSPTPSCWLRTPAATGTRPSSSCSTPASSTRTATGT